MEVILFLHIGLALWLYRYFARSDRGLKEPDNALRMACFFGVLAVIAAMFLNGALLPKELDAYLFGVGEKPSTATIIGSGFLVGIIEESVKYVPLAIFLYRKRYFNEVTDGIIYFGLAGMWFGAIENISYALQSGASVGIARLLINPFMHASFTALAGWGLARMKVLHTSSVVPIMFFLSAVGLHGFYDVLLFSQILPLTLAALALSVGINLLVFFMFKRAQKSDELLGLSAVGINRFCRVCGQPNPEGNLYCIRGGHKT